MTTVTIDAEARTLCSDILGHVQAEQRDGRLYDMVRDLALMLGVWPEDAPAEDRELEQFYEPFTGWMHVCRTCGALVAHHCRKRHVAFHGNPGGVGSECSACGSTQGCTC